MKDKIVEILHDMKCRSKLFPLQEVAEKIAHLYSAGEEVYVECPFNESSLKLVDWDKGAEQTPKAVKPVTLIDAENIIPQQLNRRDREIYETGRGNGFREGKSHAIAIQKKLTRPTVSEDEIGAEILPYLIEFDPYVDWSELLDRLSKAIKELLNR